MELDFNFMDENCLAIDVQTWSLEMFLDLRYGGFEANFRLFYRGLSAVLVEILSPPISELVW